jgi:hypothetical protein
MEPILMKLALSVTLSLAPSLSLSQGFTFEALAVGKLPFKPEKSPFDASMANQAQTKHT